MMFRNKLFSSLHQNNNIYRPISCNFWKSTSYLDYNDTEVFGIFDFFYQSHNNILSYILEIWGKYIEFTLYLRLIKIKYFRLICIKS